ncbi:MAG: hypothetical protein RR744_00420 [Cellulosilyticaceae bacterium]
MKFKDIRVGDTVEVCKSFRYFECFFKKVGTIIAVDADDQSVFVDFGEVLGEENKVKTHSGSLIASNTGYWFFGYPDSDPPISIMRKVSKEVEFDF